MAIDISAWENVRAGSSKNNVADLDLFGLEKELKWWQNQVVSADKDVRKFPGFSAQRGTALLQRDQAVGRVLQLRAIIVKKSQEFSPVLPDLPLAKKEQAIADKYKGYDVAAIADSANSFASKSSGGTGASYSQNPMTSQFLSDVKTNTWTVPKASQQTSAPVSPAGSAGQSVAPTTTTTVAPTTTTVPKQTTTTTPTGPTGPTGPSTPAKPTGPTGAASVTGPTGAASATGPAAAAKTPAVTPPGTKPANPKKGDTYTNSKNVDFKWDGKKWVRQPKKTDTSSDAWQQTIRAEFGSLWDVYNDNADVKAVIDKSVQEGWYNDETKLTAALQNTNWFRTTESSARQFAIQQSSDPATVEDNIQTTMVTLRTQANNSGIVLSDNSLRSLATNKLKFGWTDQQVYNAVGSEAVATAQMNGPQGMADLRRGQVQTKLREIADNYAQKPTQQMLDEWTKNIMTGITTDIQFTDLMRLNASTQFRSLQAQLDKGVDVKTALSTYTNTAQQVLGVDPATIDWTQDKWNKALNYQDPKTNEYRAMDSWEWNKYLRSLPEWQETDDAKRIYRNAAFSLAQAFGKTT